MTGTGPGTELSQLLAVRGFSIPSGCKCNDRAVQMNRWGVDGCRENIDTITDWLVDSAKTAGWLERIAVSTPGLSVIARREIRGLIEQAIDRASRR